MIRNPENKIIKAGTPLVFSCGEYRYEEYSIKGVYICVKEFNYMEEAKKFYLEEMNRECEEWPYCYVLNDADFDQYLINKGFLIRCETTQIHTGDYYFFDDLWKDEFHNERRACEMFAELR